MMLAACPMQQHEGVRAVSRATGPLKRTSSIVVARVQVCTMEKEGLQALWPGMARRLQQWRVPMLRRTGLQRVPACVSTCFRTRAPSGIKAPSLAVAAHAIDAAELS
mmetsp:Transcript_2613/g.10389  ORF Transcript_2613/g.10389 Transcript_2613/m.10389 type:complete len:107 (+) Transcript_2613:225-545(+)